MFATLILLSIHLFPYETVATLARAPFSSPLIPTPFHGPANSNYEAVVGTMMIGSSVVEAALVVTAAEMAEEAGGPIRVVNVTVGAGVAETTFPEASCVTIFTLVIVARSGPIVTRAMGLEVDTAFDPRPPRRPAILEATAAACSEALAEEVLDDMLIVDDDVVDEMLGVAVIVIGVAVTVIGVAETVIICVTASFCCGITKFGAILIAGCACVCTELQSHAAAKAAP